MESVSGSCSDVLECYPIGLEHKQLFAKQARKHEQEMVHAFRALTPQPCDLLEVCAPWDSPSGKAVEEAGGRVERFGVHNGFDLSTKAGFAMAAARLRELRPRYLHVSPPCFPWTTQNNMNQRNPQQRANLEQKRAYSSRILKHCLQLIEIQRQELSGQSGVRADCQSGHAGGEHPLRATSWKEPSFRKMVRLCGGERFRCDGCSFGLKSAGGFPIQKPWG